MQTSEDDPSFQYCSITSHKDQNIAPRTHDTAVLPFAVPKSSSAFKQMTKIANFFISYCVQRASLPFLPLRQSLGVFFLSSSNLSATFSICVLLSLQENSAQNKTVRFVIIGIILRCNAEALNITK